MILTISLVNTKKSLQLAIAGTSILATLAYKKSTSRAAAAADPAPIIHSIRRNLVLHGDEDLFRGGDISAKLVNATAYIETENVENLLSLPRYQNAIMHIKRANKHPTQANYQRVFTELLKLSESSSSSGASGVNKVEELIRLRIIQNFEAMSGKQ